MGLVREMHGGRDYDPAWGRRMKGEGVIAELIARRFAAAAPGSASTGRCRRSAPTCSACRRRGPEQLTLF